MWSRGTGPAKTAGWRGTQGVQASRAIHILAVAGAMWPLVACGIAPVSDLSEVSSIIAPERPEVPGRPVEAYTRIARGLKSCWLAPTAPLGLSKAYIFAAEAFPADAGGKAFIIIYERTPDGRRGLKAFAVALEPDGEDTKLGTENFRVPAPLGGQMLNDVRRWAGGEVGCTPMAPSFAPDEPENTLEPSSKPAKKAKGTSA